MTRAAMLVGVLLAGTLPSSAGAGALPGQAGSSGRYDRGVASEIAVDTRDAVGLGLDWTPERCTSPSAPGADGDADGVDDGCEHELAAAFAPELVFDDRECGWDASVPGGRVGGGYLYAVRREPASGGVRIAYLPAYYRDCGWNLPVCRITRWLCDGHSGDSELIVVDAAYDSIGRRWRTERVFLSAHCHGRSDGRCRWYEGRDLERFRWVDGVPRGAPVVWVAHGKHGGYPSREACGAGHWSYDGCDANRARRRFPVVALRQNVGSRERPFPHGRGADCVGPEEAGWGSARARSGTAECFWDAKARFRGWQGAEDEGATGYGRYLREVAGL